MYHARVQPAPLSQKHLLISIYRKVPIWRKINDRYVHHVYINRKLREIYMARRHIFQHKVTVWRLPMSVKVALRKPSNARSRRTSKACASASKYIAKMKC